jgi:DNA-directed RNA polymerase subunit RPC12/RpoP
MDAVDGNAIGGLLIDVFGTEMTAVGSTCGTCGASRPVAELVVYQRAPGTVVRCRTCGSVLMVFVKTPDEVRINLAGLASLGDSETGSTRAGRTWTQPWMPDELAAANTEGAIMSHEESMSMGTPQDEQSTSMGAPDEQSMSMGTPQEEQSMSMGTPQEEQSMSMGTPDEPM